MLDPIEKEVIKNSFKKIKEEISFLNNEVLSLKKELSKTNKCLNYINAYLKKYFSQLDKGNDTIKDSDRSSIVKQQIREIPTENNEYIRELRPISKVSIGNEGVPTDSQQTVNIPSTDGKLMSLYNKNNLDISSLLESLKRDLKQKFKSLTNQELFIFSIIYTLNEESQEVTYRDIALRAKLTESSVRDYISRLEHKGIPLIKEKKNNKVIIIKIPEELKHLSTLENLTKLKKEFN